MTARIIALAILAIVSMIGIFGLLVSAGMWDVVFFVLAALPLLLCGGLTIARKIKK